MRTGTLPTGRPARPAVEPDRSARPAGYTLAELIVVLVIVGVALSLVLPRITGLGQRERLNEAARRLTGLALEAYSDATTKSRPWFLCLDLDEKRAWLGTVRPGSEGDAGRESRYYNLPADVLIKDVRHPVDGQVREGRAAFGFWPMGGGEPGEIHLESEEGDQITIFIRPYLGRTQIEEGYLTEETSG